MNTGGEAVRQAMRRVADALIENRDYLNKLDRAVGDGDLGLTAVKVGQALQTYAEENEPGSDLGNYLMMGGMKINSAAPSTMGTLLATAMMRAGKEVKGSETLSNEQLAQMLRAAEQGIMERGGAELGDKTILDAIDPAAEAFAEAVGADKGLDEAGAALQAAAENGLETTKALRSKRGRASWVGERTEGAIDPGCALFVIVVKALRKEQQ